MSIRKAPLWAGVLACIAPVAAFAQQPGPYGGSHMWNGGWHGWIFGPLMMIVFLAVAVAVIVLLVRWLGGTPHAPRRGASLEILRERYARGEIDREEFEERRRVLGE